MINDKSMDSAHKFCIKFSVATVNGFSVYSINITGNGKK